MSTTKVLERDQDNAMLFGVIAGIANYFSFNVTLLRILAVVLVFAGFGTLILVYIAFAVFLPEKGQTYQSVNKNLETLSNELRYRKLSQNSINYVAIVLILFGTWLLLRELFPQWLTIDWNILLPVIIVLIGVIMLIKSRK